MLYTKRSAKLTVDLRQAVEVDWNREEHETTEHSEGQDEAAGLQGASTYSSRTWCVSLYAALGLIKTKLQYNMHTQEA